MMAGFFSLPTEIRIQIYRELISSTPKGIRIGPHDTGPVVVYSTNGFATSILRVCRKVHDEVKLILLKAIPVTLYIYLIYKGDKPYGSDVRNELGRALKSLSQSYQLKSCQYCVIDIRISQGTREWQRANDHYDPQKLLNAISEIKRLLLDVPMLREVEVAWVDYLGLDMDRCRTDALKPLSDLPVGYALQIRGHRYEGEDEYDYAKRREWESRQQIADWPDLLKPYKMLDFLSMSG